MVTLQKELNNSVIVALIIALALFIIFQMLRIFCAWTLKDVFILRIKDGSVLVSILSGWVTGLILFCLVAWMINHYWLPYRFHFWSLIADLLLLSVATYLGWFLGKLNWGIFYKYAVRNIKIAGPIMTFILLGFNLYLYWENRTSLIKGPDIFLISVDTLRADHLGCYGYKKNTSPHIDAFAEKNIIFRRCFAQDDLTLPSHMSILTSQYPITHEVDEKTSLAPGSVTLAEVLKDHGYATLAFVRECTWMNAEFGFDQGFDKYIVKDYFPPEPEFNAEYQNKYIERYLKKYKNRKKFVFIHYYDVHSDYRQLPYDAPDRFKGVFYPNYSGSFLGGCGDLVATKYLVHVNNYPIPMNDDDIRYIISLYDSGIAYGDKCIGDFCELLQRMGLYENSLIVLTSDHGEEFKEHGRFLHGGNLYYDQTVHVPLIIKLPGQGEEHIAVDAMVESLDIMPFVLNLLKIEKKPLMQGESFLPLIEHGGHGKDRVFALGADAARVSIRDGQWKLVADHILREEGYKLFDLTKDATECHDVKSQYPGVMAKLHKALLSKFFTSRRKGEKNEVVLTPRQREMLKSLGYIK